MSRYPETPKVSIWLYIGIVAVLSLLLGAGFVIVDGMH